MNEKERDDVENLRRQIRGLREQIDQLAKSQQSILSAQRIQLEQYRMEVIKPYAERVLRALDSSDEQAQGKDKWLRELENVQQELETLGSREVPSHAEEKSESTDENLEVSDEVQSNTDQADKPGHSS